MKYLSIALDVVTIILNTYIIFYIVKFRKSSNETDE